MNLRKDNRCRLIDTEEFIQKFFDLFQNSYFISSPIIITILWTTLVIDTFNIDIYNMWWKKNIV